MWAGAHVGETERAELKAEDLSEEGEMLMMSVVYLMGEHEIIALES